MNRIRRPRRAFTLLELLVVFAVLSILFALLLVAVQQAREAANCTACENNLRQLTLAVHNYEGAHGTMPPYATGMPGTPYANWFMYIAGFLDQGPAANNGNDTPAAPPDTKNSIITMGGAQNVHFKILECPSDPSLALDRYWGKTSYLANWLAFTDGKSGWFGAAQRFADLTNGQSNVVLFAEGYGLCNKVPRPALETPWYHTFGVTRLRKASDDPSFAPKDYTMFQVRPALPADCDNWRTQTPHTVMHAALGDGSVRGVSGGVNPSTWKQAMHSSGSGPLPADW